MVLRRWVLGLSVLAVAGAVATVTLVANRSSGPELESVSYNGSDRRIIGLADGRVLVSLRGDDADRARTIGTISGLQTDTRLIGIDFRVQNGKLYGVGDKGGIYTIGTTDAKAAKVSQLTVALSGGVFDIDFNPAANRLRVVSDAGQNLRHNLDDPMGTPPAGTTAADTNLTTPPATTPTLGVTGAAYTNNDNDPNTATTLFDLNVMTDQIMVQSPANAGSLAPTGKLGVDAADDAGFDISVSNGAFATLKVDGRYRLYRIDLLTGVAKRLGAFPAKTQVSDIAISLDS